MSKKKQKEDIFNRDQINFIRSKIGDMFGKDVGDMKTDIYDPDKDGVVNQSDMVTLQNQDAPIRFGVDTNGNYGYYKIGSNIITPFGSGGGSSGNVILPINPSPEPTENGSIWIETT